MQNKVKTVPKILVGSFLASLLMGIYFLNCSIFTVSTSAVSGGASSASTSSTVTTSGLASPTILAVAGTGTSTSSTTAVSVDLADAVAIRVLDKTGTEEINSLALDLFASYRGTLSSDYFNVEVSTSNLYGYKLFISSDYQYDDAGTPTYTNTLINLEDPTYQVPTLSGTIAKDDFSKSGNDSSGKASVNTWGYSIDDTTYNPVPEHDTTAQIAYNKSGVNRELIPVYIAANMDMSNLAGIYQNQLVFSAIPNPRPTEYSLAFASGTTDDVAGLPETITYSEASAQHAFTIPSDVPTRTGYVFLSWKDETADAEYQPGDDYTIVGDEEFKGNATLTAQWKKQDGIESITQMQQMTSAICEGTSVNATKTLVDTRDSQSYTVAKLADGKCWMTQNLEIDGPRTLRSSDSDVTKNYSLLAEKVGNVIDCNSTTSGGCIDEGYIYKETSTSNFHYYSWNAATAGTGTTSLKSGEEAASSICPKGWGLPSKSQFETLMDKYTKDTIKLAPPKMDKMGISFYYSTESARRYYTSTGRLWSKTSCITAYAYSFSPGSFQIVGYTTENYGISVRCIAK